MNHILAVAHKGSGFSFTFGEGMIAVSIALLGLGIWLGKKLDNVFLAIVVQLIFILGAGVLIAAAYPHKILPALYKISGGKLGIPS